MGERLKHLPAIAFDLGNTLLPYGGEEAEHLIRGLYDIAGVEGRSIDRSTFYESYASMVRTETAIRERSSWESDPQWRADRICEALSARGCDLGTLRSDLVEAHPVAFARCLRFPKRSIEVLEELKGRGIKLALISNAMDGKGIRLSMREHDLDGLLDPIIVSEEEGIAKPDPRIFRKAIIGLKVAPSQCAYVGDRYEIDIIGSMKAGMHPIYTRQYRTEGEPPAGVTVSATTIHDMDELLALWGG
jgi:HAD superfamily hydrolase (TIGR01549 family)